MKGYERLITGVTNSREEASGSKPRQGSRLLASRHLDSREPYATRFTPCLC